MKNRVTPPIEHDSLLLHPLDLKNLSVDEIRQALKMKEGSDERTTTLLELQARISPHDSAPQEKLSSKVIHSNTKLPRRMSYTRSAQYHYRLYEEHSLLAA